VRLRSGPFTLDESLTLEELAQALEDGSWVNYLYAADEALLDRLAVIVGPAAEKRVLLGQELQFAGSSTLQALEEGPLLLDASLLRAYSTDGRFLGILCWQASTHTWRPQKVLNSTPVD
jgi:tRNA pseudouridine55 synthase